MEETATTSASETHSNQNHQESGNLNHFKIFINKRRAEDQKFEAFQNIEEKKVDRAQKRRAEFKALQIEIEAGMDKARAEIGILEKKIKDNIYSQQNAQGLLTCSEADYLNCIELK